MLTKNERKVLQTIIEYVNKKGYSPSIRELCRALGVKSTSTIHGYLVNLESRGYIFREKLTPRSIGINMSKPIFKFITRNP